MIKIWTDINKTEKGKTEKSMKQTARSLKESNKIKPLERLPPSQKRQKLPISRMKQGYHCITTNIKRIVRNFMHTIWKLRHNEPIPQKTLATTH